MKNLKKSSLVGIVLSVTLLLVFFTTSTVEGASFNYTDPGNDVIEASYNQGTMTSLKENVAKPEIDIEGINIEWNPSMTQNSTIALTFAGTPAYDEYHSYIVTFNLTIKLNATHQYNLDLSVIAGAFSDLSGETQSIAPWTLYLYTLQNASGDDIVDDWGLPISWGIGYQNISYSISGNTLTFSFGISSDDSDFVNAASGATSNEMNEVEAWAYVGDDSLWNYENSTGTLWYDFYPNDDNASNGSGDSNTNTNTDNSTESENSTEDNNPLAALTPGFLTPLSLISLVFLGILPILKKRKRLQ